MSIFNTWPILIARAISSRRNILSSGTLNFQRHLNEAISWILTAREHSRDGGIPAHYDLLRSRWAPSYPETTAYTIPTLLACAEHLDRPELCNVATELADYLLDVRTCKGGIGHWDQQDGQPDPPIIFDTGQAIFGWLSAWHEAGNPVYLQAARDAGDWLVEVQDDNGAWSQYQHLDTVKVIDARVALALVSLAQATSCPAYTAAAKRNLDWVLAQQESNGWLRHAAFRAGDDPYTHTIAYTAEGLLASGHLLQETHYMEAAEQTAGALLNQQRPDGALASTYNSDWQATSRSSCLTGNCQASLIWLRLYRLSENETYLEAARRAIAFVASTQNMSSSNVNIRGAIAGSYPIFGRYERFTYPNWAAKFFIDALLALHKIECAEK